MLNHLDHKVVLVHVWRVSYYAGKRATATVGHQCLLACLPWQGAWTSVGYGVCMQHAVSCTLQIEVSRSLLGCPERMVTNSVGCSMLGSLAC